MYLNETMGHFLVHFIAETGGIGREGWKAVTVEDGIHRYDSERVLKQLVKLPLLARKP